MLKNVLCQEMEQQQQLGRENVYRDHLIPEGPLTFPMGNCPSLDSLNCEYQMAALGWSEARWARCQDWGIWPWPSGGRTSTHRWGMIDTKEVKYVIKFSGWGTPQSALHQQSSDTAAPSRPATATTTRMPMATTAAPSTEVTAGTSNEPNTASPSAKKHYKKHFVINTKQDWTDISWST